VSGLAFGEEAAQDKNLSNGGNKNDDGLTNGPILNSFVEILGKRPALRLTKSVMCLVVYDALQ